MNNKPAFTPGTWKVSEGTNVARIWGHGENGPLSHCVAECVRTAAYGDNTHIINAHLISAAKELYEACKAAAEELFHSAHMSGDPYDPNNNQGDAVTFRQLRAALDKAEGKQ